MRETLEPEIAAIRDELRCGRGFVIQGPAEAATDDEARALYWLLGSCLGRPVKQNVQGTFLYDVRDTGQSVEYGVRFSVTSADSSFHNDASFVDRDVPFVCSGSTTAFEDHHEPERRRHLVRLWLEEPLR